jgi:hypothetical protein
MGIVKSALKKAKDFVKKSAAKIKKNSKKFIEYIKRTAVNKKSRATFEPGKLVAFNYDAKHKQYRYDKNPLVIMLGPSRKHKNLYLGLNIHWLPLNERVSIASFFLELLEKRKGKLTYDDVKPFIKMFKGKPVLRSYIYERVSNKVYEMDPDMYLSAAAVPTEKWMGGK